MLTPGGIRRATFVLEVDGKQKLFILLEQDGTIQRSGTGSEDSTETRLYMGRTQPPPLDALRQKVRADLFQYGGIYDLPNPAGKPCKLVVGLDGEGGAVGFEIRFGSESLGIPAELYQLLCDAIDITEPWYEQQKAGSQTQ